MRDNSLAGLAEVSMTRFTFVAEPSPHFTCRCGARVDAVEDMTWGQVEPSYLAGSLTEPCRCSRCFGCQRLLDDEGRCENLDCLNVGLHIPSPD